MYGLSFYGLSQTCCRWTWFRHSNDVVLVVCVDCLISAAYSEPDSSTGGRFSFRRCRKLSCEQRIDRIKGSKKDIGVSAYVLEFLLEQVNHVFLNHDTFLVQIFDDEIVVDAIDVDDDGLDGRIAFDQDA